MVEKLSLVNECARQILGMDLSKTGQFKIIDLSMGLALYCAQMKTSFYEIEKLIKRQKYCERWIDRKKVWHDKSLQ